MFLNKAQGAIEYLLIIGAVILVIALVIIGLSGLLNDSSDFLEDDSSFYEDAYMDLKTKNIGLTLSIKSGTHESFKIAVQPKDNSLPVIFSSAPIGTTVRINYGNTFEKTNSGWGEGEDALINLNDIVDIEVPSGASDLELNLKGNYTKPSPQEITFSCDGTGVKNYSIIVYFPLKEKELKTIFKDFFNEPVLGSELKGVISGAWMKYESKEICGGNACINLNEFECNSVNSFCSWNTEDNNCYSPSFNCDTDYSDLWQDDYSCEKVGCESMGYQFLGGLDDTLIEQGSNIELTCGVGQILNAVLEEDDSIVINKAEDVNVVQYLTNSFYLKNYHCYDFNKVYNSFREVIVPLVSSGGFSVTCYRGEEKATGNYSKNIWGNVDEQVTNRELKIFPETICSVSSHTPNIPTIKFVCD